MTTDGDAVATWKLDRVIPVRWSGPSLNPDTPKVAMETVELAHHGFLPGTD
jgi:phage tail-like protein